MSLPAGEPAAGPWRVVPVDELVGVLFEAAGAPVGRPRLVAVDGRSAGGKSTLSDLLRAAVPASAVVHTDDVAWGHSFFEWADPMVGGVLEPLHRGEAVRFRPPGWDSAGRAGHLEVPAGMELVLVEGVGAGRRELAHRVDAVVWVQSDFAEAERRGIARDVASGVNGDRDASIAFWHQWMREETAFLADQRPWERACVVVAGTSVVAHDDTEVVVAPPPRQGPSPRRTSP